MYQIIFGDGLDNITVDMLSSIWYFQTKGSVTGWIDTFGYGCADYVAGAGCIIGSGGHC